MQPHPAPPLIALACVLALLLALSLALLLADYAAPRHAARLWLRLERSLARLREREARVAQFTLPYLEGGRGQTLVLVHGFGGDKDNFTRLARHLTPHLRLVVPDLPGFGEASRDPEARYRIGDQVARLRLFLVALGLERCHLGGNSMGGFIAAQYAATWPDAVQSLWLLDAAGCAAAYDNAIGRRYLASGEVPLLVRTPADFDALFPVVMQHAPWLPHSLRHELARRAVADFALHTRIFREFARESPTLEERYGAIRAPTLIVWGREDRMLNPAAATVMAARIARNELILMPDTGHLPMVERPRAVAADYRRFLAAQGYGR
jgi:pimeloyl-ACP methyl ester carboxylesterase